MGEPATPQRPRHFAVCEANPLMVRAHRRPERLEDGSRVIEVNVPLCTVWDHLAEPEDLARGIADALNADPRWTGEDEAAPPPASLTPPQLAALHLITAAFDRDGVAPSVRDLARWLGLSAHSGASRLLQGLERAGWIRRTAAGSHNITLLHRPPAAWSLPDDQRKPLADTLREAADRLEAETASPTKETADA